MSIPITPSSISGAGTFNIPTTAKASNICRQPPEGMAFVPMQFTFTQYTAWLVNMASGSPNPPLSQVACLFVDASLSTHDVSILFPDTGYQVQIEQGGGRIIPALTGNVLPKFYVSIDSSDEFTSDIVNVIAINQFIPEFSSNEVQKVLSYGYGQMFELQPAFSQSTSFTLQVSNPTTTGVIIPHNQWYITAMNVAVITAAGSNTGGILQFTDNNVVFKQYIFDTTQSLTYQLLTDVAGLSYISSGNGTLQYGISATGDYQFTINIDGGVLVT